MVHSHLRIYRPPQTTAPVESASSGQVAVRLGDVVHLLADAVRANRTWLRDFADDEVSISSDLYDVLMAYKFFRPSA